MARALAVAAVVFLGIAYVNGYLGHRRRAAHSGVTGTVTAADPNRDAVLAWVAVALVPVVFLIWFATSMALFADANDLSDRTGWTGVGRVILLWVTVEVVPVFGIVFGRRAARRHEAHGRTALVANLAIFVAVAAVTLGAGLMDVLA